MAATRVPSASGTAAARASRRPTAEHRQGGRERQAAAAHGAPDAGETTGPMPDRERIERSIVEPEVAQEVVGEGDQLVGLAAAGRQATMPEQSPGLGPGAIPDRRRAGRVRAIEGQQQHGIEGGGSKAGRSRRPAGPRRPPARSGGAGSRCRLEGRGGGRAAGAGAAHVQVHHAVAEAAEGDVAAVLGHRRADAGLDQLLDLATISASPRRTGTVGRRRPRRPLDHRLAGEKCSMIAPSIAGLRCVPVRRRPW